MPSAAGSLEWLRRALAPGSNPAELLVEAARWPAGCEGLGFAPYLSGERTPRSDPDASGAFVGLTSSHDRGAMVRAVLEGVAFRPQGLPRDRRRSRRIAGRRPDQRWRLALARVGGDDRCHPRSHAGAPPGRERRGVRGRDARRRGIRRLGLDRPGGRRELRTPGHHRARPLPGRRLRGAARAPPCAVSVPARVASAQLWRRRAARCGQHQRSVTGPTGVASTQAPGSRLGLRPASAPWLAPKPAAGEGQLRSRSAISASA